MTSIHLFPSSPLQNVHSTKNQYLLETICQGIRNISSLALRNFGLISNSVVFVFGAKELFLDYPLEVRDIKKLDKHMKEKKLEASVEWFYKKVRSVKCILAENCHYHGSFYLASGYSGAINALHHHGYINLGDAAPLANFLCWGPFLFANLLLLRTNIKVFQKAEQLAKSDGQKEKALADQLKLSSVMGIINSLGYIFATIFTLFEGPLALALAIGTLAFCVGAVKIIYDFFALSPALSTKKIVQN